MTNIATEMVARKMGIDLLAPNVKASGTCRRTPARSRAASCLRRSSDAAAAGYELPPGVDNGTHSGINRKPSALRQVEKFLLENTVVQTCSWTVPGRVRLHRDAARL